MSFLKSLFGKDSSQKSACCDIKIVEVKPDTAAASENQTAPSQTEKK
ncbi:hypothetical protein JJB07_21340 [Tumebacillus sp. ITR2]|uniref:Uncharacterized protein n=1 Tax=Tumebacillus amylolyticus TaxID=2801339 RepID=A0ABS1JHF2_9BACL|nr:hypothetical protein [Tumebacillus amylolyticus]MBL0389143.1 hypothetical protein [Tumebacillus amylolyticus]